MLYFLQGDYHLLSPFQQKAQLWILSFKLLSHLETYAHAIVAVGDGTHCAESRAALEGAEHLDEVEKLLLVEEKTDTIGGLGGIARSTQQKTLQMDGMSLLIKGIGALPWLAVNLRREVAVGGEGELGV